MNIFGVGPTGESFRLDRTHDSHLRARNEQPERTGEANNFEALLFDSLNEVDRQQQEHKELTIQASIDPDSVDAHDITVAAARAELSLRITKNVVDRVISAYREIINLR